MWAAKAAHGGVAVNCVAALSPAASLLATGDDDGGVRIWDTRARAGNAASLRALQTDVVTDLAIAAEKGALAATSGDGSVAVYDLRAMRAHARTPAAEDELLCVSVLKDGAALATGTAAGNLLLWDWATWAGGEASKAAAAASTAEPERLRGHPESVDALLTVDSDTVLTGAADGLIRLVTMRPSKLVAIVGEHGEEPIEALALSHDKAFLASASHDCAVKFWDVAYLFDGSDEPAGGRSRFTRMPALVFGKSTDDDDNDDDDDDDDDDGDGDSDDESGDEGDDDTAAAVPAPTRRSQKGATAMDEDDSDQRRGGGGSKSGRTRHTSSSARGSKGAGAFFSDL